MKSFITFLLVFLAGGVVLAESFPERRWFVKNDCAIIIHGESNVNNFSCKVDRYYSADNLVLYNNPGEKYTFSDNQIVIDPRRFDCGKAPLTRDFQQTLKTDENPEIIISFISLSSLPCNSCKEDFVDGLVRITMAGVTKESVITFSVKTSIHGTKVLQGIQEFTFSDFELDPPSKFMGMVQVKNQLSVTFALQFQELALK
jgi:hypothetical protein